MNIYIKITLFFLLLIPALATSMSSVFASEEDYFSVHRTDGSLAYLFGFPRCLPTCDAEDKAQLTATSVVEENIIEVIASADKTIFFSQYTFSRQPIFTALLAAKARGVKVLGAIDKGQLRVLAEYCKRERCEGLPPPFDSTAYRQASFNDRLIFAGEQALFKAATLSEKLAILFWSLPDGSEVRFLGGSKLMHHKFLLVDDDVFLTGSGNWSSTAVSINLENTIFSSDQVAIKAFSCIARALWLDPQIRRGASTACQTEEWFFSPVNAGGSGTIVQEIIKSITDSRQTIDIAMHHLVHPGVIFELSRAIHRGVNIRILTDDDFCMQRLNPDLNALIQAGAKMQFMQTACQLFQLAHHKYGVFDGRKLINGSGNWSLAGLERNYENFIVTTDLLAVNAFQSAFGLYWSGSATRTNCGCDPSNQSCRERYCMGQ